MRTKILIVSLGLTSLLSGCASSLNTAGSSEFACPGMPGVMCRTPAEVYKMSHGDKLNPAALDAKKTAKAAVPKTASLSDSAVPVPIRTQAVVMRTWIAPWKDKNDDLHWPSYIYTEIEGRKWSFGNQDFSGMNSIIPYKASVAKPVKGGSPSVVSQTQQSGSFVDDSGISQAAQLP